MVGTLNVITIPEGAKIFMDGIDTLKISPYTFTLEPTVHDYRLSLNAYMDVHGSVDVIDNQQTNLVITMPDDFYNKLIIISTLALGISVISMFRK